MPFYQKKLSDAQDLNGDYYLHVPFQKLDQWPDPIKIASFDFGNRNFCVRVEKRYSNGDYIVVYRGLKDLGPKNVTPLPVFTELTLYLLSIQDYLTGCHLCLTEKQLSKNPFAIRLEAHTIGKMTEIMILNKQPGYIIQIAATLKGKYLEAPPTTRGDTRKLKKWSKCVAIEKAFKQGEDWVIKLLVMDKHVNMVRSMVIDYGYSGTDLYEFLQYADGNGGGRFRLNFEYEPVKFLKPAKGDDFSDTKIQVDAVAHILHLPKTIKCIQNEGEHFKEIKPGPKKIILPNSNLLSKNSSEIENKKVIKIVKPLRPLNNTDHPTELLNALSDFVQFHGIVSEENTENIPIIEPKKIKIIRPKI